MKAGVMFCSGAVLLCLVFSGDCRADSSGDGGKSDWRVAVSGAYGLVSTFQADQSGWDLTPQRESGFPEPAVALSVRFAKIPPGDIGFRGCVDISFYYFSVPLSTYRSHEIGSTTVSEYHLGYVRGRWIVVTPGWQRLDPDGTGLSWFLGLTGVGFSLNGFGTNPYLEGGAAEAARQISVNSGFVVAIVPAKVEWMIADKVSAGISFSGVLLSKPGIDAPPENDEWPRPSGEELNLSNVHLHGVLSFWLL